MGLALCLAVVVVTSQLPLIAFYRDIKERSSFVPFFPIFNEIVMLNSWHVAGSDGKKEKP